MRKIDGARGNNPAAKVTAERSIYGTLISPSLFFFFPFSLSLHQRDARATPTSHRRRNKVANERVNGCNCSLKERRVKEKGKVAIIIIYARVFMRARVYVRAYTEYFRCVFSASSITRAVVVFLPPFPYPSSFSRYYSRR